MSGRFLFLLTAAIPAFGQCLYNITPNTLNVPANGGAASVSVTTNLTTCAWSYSTDSPAWITLSASGASNNSIDGSGALSVTAAASTLPSARSGNVLIETGNTTATVAVNQGAAQCSMTLDPASATLPVSGGSSAFTVQTACTWTAVSNTLWLTIPAPGGGPSTNSASGTGNGTVNYIAAANTCAAPQTGTISVAAQPLQVFTVTENGSPSNMTFLPPSASAPQTGATGRLNIITGVTCGWSAFSDVGWLHLTTGAAGTGNGGLGYSVDANSGGARTGNIHVGPQLFAVTQAGAALPALQLSAVENAASYASGSVAPGEIVALFGGNIGPAPGMGLQLSANRQSITNAIGGVEVLFDGNPVPLTYVSAGQINAIAPVGLAGKSSTQVQVSYQGAMSNAMMIPVAAAAPGIFAADGSGAGSGAILNQDFSLNTRLNPAARGSVIAIYLTGAGATAPPSADGAITGNAAPFPSVAQSVAVTIGGLPVPAAQIVYSGAAPGSVEGLTQIDAYIPQNVAPAGPVVVPVVVTIGGVASQPGITVSVN